MWLEDYGQMKLMSMQGGYNTGMRVKNAVQLFIMVWNFWVQPGGARSIQKVLQANVLYKNQTLMSEAIGSGDLRYLVPLQRACYSAGDPVIVQGVS